MDHLIGTPALKPYMHGYFISLQLYDTARVIANPYAYAEHRERMVQEKMEKMVESRIRTKKDTVKVKVNKVLAEKIKKEEERIRKREEKRAAKGSKTPRAETQAEAEDGAEAMDVDESAKTEKPSLLNDPRFTALFEDPEFQVDETTREFALLNPSTVAQAQNRGRTKTAVEQEEEESDRPSSDGLSDDDESEDKESDNGSEDSDDAGGKLSRLRQYRSIRLICLQLYGRMIFVLVWPHAIPLSKLYQDHKIAVPTCVWCHSRLGQVHKDAEWTKTLPSGNDGRIQARRVQKARRGLLRGV